MSYSELAKSFLSDWGLPDDAFGPLSDLLSKVAEEAKLDERKKCMCLAAGVRGTPQTEVPRIVGVALRAPDGTIYSLPAPNRHHHLIQHVVSELKVIERVGTDWEQGFVDSEGRWLRRKPALIVATKANQLKPGTVTRGGQLYSEDIW